MEAIRDEDYVDFGISFQSILVDHLNIVLKEKGVEEQDVRKDICETFLLGLGNFIDRYWFEYEGQRVHPMLAFSENHLDVHTPLEELGTVLFAPGDFSQREYAVGVVADFFEDNEEEIPGIVTGIVGEEEEDDYEVDDMG